jgi:hypothetical protein
VQVESEVDISSVHVWRPPPPPFSNGLLPPPAHVDSIVFSVYSSSQFSAANAALLSETNSCAAAMEDKTIAADVNSTVDNFVILDVVIV